MTAREPRKTDDVIEAMVAQYWPAVLRFCERRLWDRADAEEAAQDTFVQVARALPTFEGRSTVRTWVLGVAKNVCAAYRARAARRAEREADWAKMSAADASFQPELETGDAVASRVLERLSPSDRQVLHLRYAADLSLEQIATRSGATLSATKMRLYRAMERFRLAYNGTQSDAGNRSPLAPLPEPAMAV